MEPGPMLHSIKETRGNGGGIALRNCIRKRRTKLFNPLANADAQILSSDAMES